MAEFRSNTIEEIDEVLLLPYLLLSHNNPGRYVVNLVIAQAYKTLQATFRAGTTRPFSWRKRQLNQVILMLRENIEAIAQATAADLRKPRQEIVVGEVGLIIRRATQCIAQLDAWASDETVPLQDWQQNWSAAVLKRPKGVVFVISCVLIIPSSQ
jgi:aldehyde dehydrogenase (NAD+)